MELSEIKTCELVAELRSREGVRINTSRTLSEERDFCGRSCGSVRCYRLAYSLISVTSLYVVSQVAAVRGSGHQLLNGLRNIEIFIQSA